MEIPTQDDEKMEGWLYLIRLNRIGLEYYRKKYFILEQNCLKSFKSKPPSRTQEPVRSAIIDSCIRVTDNGRESSHSKIFFVFTLFNTANHKDRIKLGARRPEEAARWIQSLQDVALKPGTNSGSSKGKWQPFRLNISKKTHNKSLVDWPAAASMHVDAMTSDVIAPSPWKIFGCQNGLRLFKESKKKDSSGKRWDENPAIMAVGVVDGTSEAVFQTIMSLGPSRSEWDYCFHRGSMVEHLDGHTDIIHMQLYKDFLPWVMKKRDFLVRRYWRREDDGTYVILYHSVIHQKCPPQQGYVRAFLKSGGYVVMPVNQGKQSVVKHMLAIDWKFWKPYIRKVSAKSLTTQMLMRVSALREMFKANSSNYDVSRGLELPQIVDKENINKVEEVESSSREEDKKVLDETSLFGLNDPSDEFFDVPGPTSDDRQSDQEWSSDQQSECSYLNKVLTTTSFVKKLHDLTVQKKVYADTQELSFKDGSLSTYGSTLPSDSSRTQPCTWSAADPSSFLIRGKSFLKDRQKVKAKGTLMQMVAADWLRSDKREDDIGSRHGGIVQKYATLGGLEFFFIINIQVPGTPMYNLVVYYMLKTPLEESPLLESFVNGDDAYRNSRFKLIPYISEGSWIVKQSVGKKAGLVGQALEINYFRGNNYMELCINVGSSTVARGVVSLVLGYLNNLVIEMAFLIQGNTEEELPEFLLGTCRLNHMNIVKAVPTDSIKST